MTEQLEVYRIYFDWANPAGLSEVTLRGGWALCNSSKAGYLYIVGNHRLIPDCKYFWEISLETGVNFKIGVVRAGATMADSLDLKEAYVLTSRGVVQSAVQDKPEKEEDSQIKYCSGDKVGVFYDGQKGTIIYYINGRKLGTFFVSSAFKKETFLPVVCMMTEGELLSVVG